MLSERGRKIISDKESVITKNSIMKKRKEWYRYLHYCMVSTLLLFVVSCTTFLDDEKYVGEPHSLRYMQIDNYRIGDNYVSITPTVMGGENATFEIESVEGPVSDEILKESFSINSQEGNINIKEFCGLISGRYSLDVKVTNSYGSKIFENAFGFNATQVEPSKLRYVPSLYSFYGPLTGNYTSPASANGGGPYLFSMNDTQNYFSINEETGVITKEAVVALGEDDVITRTFDIEVSNEIGTHTEHQAVTIELIGANVGKLAFNMEYTESNTVDLGIINGEASTYIGTYADIVNGEDYTTILSTSVNGPIYKGGRHANSWHSAPSSVVMDKSGGGDTETKLFLSFKTSSSTTECVSMVVTDTISLDVALSAYTEIQAYKRFIDNDFNQRFALLVCADDEYIEDDMFATPWTVLSENIAPGMLPYSNPIKESELYENGKQAFDLPADLLGQKVRLALKAVHLNPSLGNIGREAFIYKWQVRAKY